MSDGQAYQVATLGGGCFWCLEAVFLEVEGVQRVVSGYAGGHTTDPTYADVCAGRTGHAEVVQVHFDPRIVTYSDLVRIFFAMHDPTTEDRQGADVGPQYRSVILWHDDGQRAVAREVIDEVESSGAYGAPLVTELEPLTAFYEAEPHHQAYRDRNPGQPYCRLVIDPKLEKFRRVFARHRRAGPLLMAGLLWVASALANPAISVSQDLISTSAMLSAPPVPADQRIRYGPDPLHFGDLYLPVGTGPHPVAVVVHGGCWRALAGLDYTSHIARELADQGWAAWNLEFRRIDQPGGAWPGILEDVARGADHVRALASSFRLDTTRVVAVGHSSGGHLALWLASRDGLPPDAEGGPRLRGEGPLRMGGVVGLAAIVDLEDFHLRGERGCGGDIVPLLLGRAQRGSSDDSLDSLAERLTLTSPGARLPLGVPQLLMTGAADRTVPLAHVEAYAARASSAGDIITLLAVPRSGHFEVVAPWAASFDEVRAALGSFLARMGLPG
jgi:peptide-methionine (S)-S-oxide reductase